MEKKKVLREHPFEKTLDKGPYHFDHLWILQKPTEYNHFQDNYSSAPKTKKGVGSCSHCGTGIIYNYIIANGAGELFAVGCECVRKLGLPYVELTEFEKTVIEEKKAVHAARRAEKGTFARSKIEKLLKEHADILKNEKYNQWYSYFDYTTFCLKNMGDANIHRLAKRIESLINNKEDKGEGDKK